MIKSVTDDARIFRFVIIELGCVHRTCTSQSNNYKAKHSCIICKALYHVHVCSAELSVSIADVVGDNFH